MVSGQLPWKAWVLQTAAFADVSWFSCSLHSSSQDNCRRIFRRSLRNMVHKRPWAEAPSQEHHL